MDSKIRQVRELFSNKLTRVHQMHSQTLFKNQKGDFQFTGETEGTRIAKLIFKKKNLDKLHIVKEV